MDITSLLNKDFAKQKGIQLMKNILVLSFSNLKLDARVTRQINFIKEHYHVTAFCFDADPNEKGYQVYKVKPTGLTLIRKVACSIFLLLRQYQLAYRLLYDYGKYVVDLRKKTFDLIIANDAETLPLAFQISNSKSKVFFDAHEYAPRQFEDRLYWRIFFQRFTTYLCKTYIPHVVGMSTINNGIASEYEIRFGIKPIIITNAANYFNMKPRQIEGFPIKLVHHGIFNLSRRPELMLDLFDTLDEKFTLDLIYLLPANSSKKTKAYFEEFKLRASKNTRVKVLPALKSSEIVSVLNERYDMGIILVPPVNFNYENGLPNKLFDCIQARMAMAVGPLKEIADVTKTYNIGVVSKDFTPSGMAQELNKLTIDNVMSFKNNSEKAAREMNAEENKKILLEALQKLS